MTAFDAGTTPQRDRTAAMLARAFADDPAMAFIFPDRATRMRRLPALFRLLYSGDLDGGGIMLAPDEAAATLWRAPGRASTTLPALLREAIPLVAALGGNAWRAFAVLRAIEAHMPPGHYWYLHVAGCDPARQGGGLGRGAVRAGLDRLVRDQACYLETANAANLGFYTALGFAVVDEWQVRRGPRFWSMWRPGPRD